MKEATGCTVSGPAAENIPARDVAFVGGLRAQDRRSRRARDRNPRPHARPHRAWSSTTPRIAFVGDTLFAMGCGRLFEGTAEQMHHSLQRLAALPEDTALYCGHEYTLANARFATHAEPDNPAIAARLDKVEALREGERSRFRPASPRNVKPIPSFAPLRWRSSRG